MAKKVQIVQPDLSGNDNTVTTVTERLVKGGARTSNKAPQQMKSVRITISISPEVESKLNALLTIAKLTDSKETVSNYICGLVEKESKEQAENIKNYNAFISKVKG